jgi:iron complex outermembrane receptor protein
MRRLASCVCLCLALLLRVDVAAAGTSISGRVVHALTAQPLSGVRVRLDARGHDVVTGADGAYRFDDVDIGRHTLTVAGDGFAVVRRAVDVSGTTAVDLDLPLSPLLVYSETVSVRAHTGDPFVAAQALTVLTGQDLGVRLEPTIGAVLRASPGVAERSSGPGPSRPVIRGLDGDRVLIVQDGHGMGDVSSQSADHGVNVNPAMATSIEVIRGPATLLYGSSAMGGVVNVVTDTLPRSRFDGGSGRVTLDGGTAARDLGGAAVWRWGQGPVALSASGARRQAGDLRTPLGKATGTALRSTYATVGGSWVGERGFAGVTYGFDQSKYGLPAAFASEAVTLDPRRHSVTVRGERELLTGPVQLMQVSGAYRHYRHDEVEGGEVGTSFENRLREGRVLLRLRPLGRLSSTAGVEVATRSFSATGVEALSPPVDQRSAAVFAAEEFTIGRVSAQGGVRVEQTRYDVADGVRRSRQFTAVSASLGLVARPTRHLTLAGSLTRTARRPALEELYFNGLHIGNFAFEVGNDALSPETALGVEVSTRWSWPRWQGTVTAFRSGFSRFIFREPDGVLQEGFPVYAFVARDSNFAGVELRSEGEVAPGLWIDTGADIVAGRLQGGTPLPRMPPWRGFAGLRYRRGAWQSGLTAQLVANQRRIFPTETATDGYRLLDAFWAWSTTRHGVLHTVTMRIDNLTNVLYRNHLSFIKAQLPERGRNLKLVYTWDFD